MSEPTLRDLERAWEAAMRAWNRGSDDPVKIVQQGEDLYFAGLNLVGELRMMLKRGDRP